MQTTRAVILLAGHGGAWRMRRGEEVRIVNTHGSQAVDAWALSDDESATGFGTVDYSSMEHTRSVTSRVFVETGTSVVGTNRRPLFTMIGDSTAGRHDTQLCPCNRTLYEDLGQPSSHRSCASNFHEALGELGLRMPFTPASLNLFMQVGIEADGSIRRDLPSAAAGDHVTLRADSDIVLVLSACPQDVTPINGADCTPRDVELVFDRKGTA